MAIPTLSYAAVRSPRWASTVILLLMVWAIVDFIFGPLLVVGSGVAFYAARFGGMTVAGVCIGVYLHILGWVIFFWGIGTMVLSRRIHRGVPGSLRLAWKTILIAEVGCYLGIWIVVLFAIRDGFWESWDKVGSYILAGGLYLVMPVCVTLTRILVRHCARNCQWRGGGTVRGFGDGMAGN